MARKSNATMAASVKKKAEAKKKASATKSAMKSGAKKQKVDPVQEKVQILLDCIEEHEERDPDVKEILLSCANKCFNEPIESRHQFFGKFIGMIDDTLHVYHTNLHQRNNDKLQAIDECESKLQDHDLILENLKNSMETKKEEIAAKETEIEGLEALAKEAKAALKATKKQCDSGLAPLRAEEVKLKEAMETKAIYEGLSDAGAAATSTAKDRKKNITALINFLKKIDAHGGLLAACSYTLNLVGDDRGSFDHTILNEIANTFIKYETQTKENIVQEKTENAELLAQFEKVDTDTTQGINASQAANDQLDVLQEEKKEIQSQLKFHNKEVTSKKNETVKLRDQQSDIVQQIEQLSEVVTTVEELKNRSANPVPEEKPDDDVVEIPDDEEVVENRSSQGRSASRSRSPNRRNSQNSNGSAGGLSPSKAKQAESSRRGSRSMPRNSSPRMMHDDQY